MFDIVYTMIDEFFEMLPYMALCVIVLDIIGSCVFKKI